MTTPDLSPAVALEPKTKLSGKILKTTLAGALVDIGQPIPGVIHISQLSDRAVNKSNRSMITCVAPAATAVPMSMVP